MQARTEADGRHREITTRRCTTTSAGTSSNALTLGNLPDVFFKLARRYNVTVLEDAANSAGLSLLFGSLARAYHVRSAQEWTPTTTTCTRPGGAVDVQLRHGTAAGRRRGLLHPRRHQQGRHRLPDLHSWLPILQHLSGTYPKQPVAVYIDYSKAWGNTSGGSLTSVENNLAALWADYQAGFAVVTSEELANPPTASRATAPCCRSTAWTQT